MPLKGGSITIHCPDCKRKFVMSKWFLETAGRKWYLKRDYGSESKLCIDCQAVKYNYIGNTKFITDTESFFFAVFEAFRKQAMKRTL